MSVWVCAPSARPVAEVNTRMDKWRAMGYKVALWRDQPAGVNCDFSIIGEYPGIAQAHNRLIEAAFQDKDCDWVVAGADDTDPDPTKTAVEIELDCSVYFSYILPRPAYMIAFDSTFGVMQPTGDRWGDNEPHLGKLGSAYIDRICGSPWIGREFARRVNQGNGPFWTEYSHMFADEELQTVATRLGVLWQRRDLTHYHDHCRRDGVARTPEFLTEAYSATHWLRSAKLFYERQAAGFPGSECIA